MQSLSGGEIAGNAEPVCSVVIAAWNRLPDLREALHSVFAQTLAERLEVIVIDNGSRDGTPDWLREGCPHSVRGFAYGQNAGASAARNAGILLARAPRICFVDSDAVLLSPDILARCLDHLDEAPPQIVAVAAPIWLDRERTRPFCFGGYLTPEGHFHRVRSQSETRDPMFLSTCFAVWEARVLRELGGFDPWLFWGNEDVDLASRARAGRWSRGRQGPAGRFEIAQDVHVWHKMTRDGRVYSPDDFDSTFCQFERERLRLALARGGLREFLRVIVTTPFHLRRVERDAWERPLSLRQKWLMLGWHPAVRLARLPADWFAVRRDHLAETPLPEPLR